MGKLALQDLARILEEKNGLGHAEAEQFVSAMFSVIQQALEQGQQVKVRGLGTFKIVNVDARESVNVNTGERVLIAGHSKISFVPDTTMRELVNKPFSQFETVVLSEGVEFDNMEVSEVTTDDPADTDDEEVTILPDNREDTVPAMVGLMAAPATPATPAEEEQTELPAVATEEEPAEEPVEQASNEVSTEDAPTEEAPTEEPPTEEPPTEESANEVPVEEERQEEVSEEEHQEEVAEDETEDDSEESGSSWRWLLGVLGILLLLAGAVAAGYYIGYGKGLEKGMSVVKDSVAVPTADSTALVTDTLQTVPAEEEDASLSADTATSLPADQMQEAEPAKQQPADSQVKETPKPQAEAKPQPKPEPKPEPKPQTAPAQDANDKYAAMDVRVKYGGYRIVGLDHTEKIRPGDTSARIAKRTLGEGMECYTQLQAVQTVKIPKVVLKKKQNK